MNFYKEFGAMMFGRSVEDYPVIDIFQQGLEGLSRKIKLLKIFTKFGAMAMFWRSVDGYIVIEIIHQVWWNDVWKVCYG